MYVHLPIPHCASCGVFINIIIIIIIIIIVIIIVIMKAFTVAVPIFHAYAHNALCQYSYSP